MNGSWSSYPKVWNMGHPAIANLLIDEVLVEEKVDGSQFSFGRFMVDGGYVLRIRSKGVEMNMDAPEKMFAKAVATVRALEEKLMPGWTYRAEFLQKPHHNGLAYDRVPEQNLIIFDITTGQEYYMPREFKETESKRLGLEVVPVLYQGRIAALDQFKALLDIDSMLGGQKIEGVVVKNYRRFGEDGKPLFGKYVSEFFREVQKKEWRKSNPTNGDILAELVMTYSSPARFAKAVQHLHEAGKLTDSPKDIGPLLIEVQNDIEKEEAAIIMTKLFAWAWPKIRRGVTGGLPEWYKNELLTKQFNGGTNAQVSSSIPDA